jgi:hypothetical protein
MFPVCGGTAPEFTSASVSVWDPIGDSAGAGLTGAWIGGDVESIGMGRPIGAVALPSSIVTVSITAIQALVIVPGWTSAVVAGSAAAHPECAPAPLADSIMEAHRGGFPLVARAVSEADSMEEVSAAAASTAEDSAAVAAVSAARHRRFDCASGVWENFYLPLKNSSKGKNLCCAMQSIFGDLRW